MKMRDYVVMMRFLGCIRVVGWSPSEVISASLDLGLSLRRLLRVIERMYRLDLSIYNVNPVKNVIHSISSFHIEDGCNVISLDDVLL